MIKVFEKIAPSYRRVLTKYARDIWEDKEFKEEDFFKDVERFAKRYKNGLIKYYKDKNINIYPGTIKVKVEVWIEQQKSVLENIKKISKIKKTDMKKEITDEFIKETKGETLSSAMLTGLKKYVDKKTSSGLAQGVFAFSLNLSNRAGQLADQAAFEFANDINNEILEKIIDKYTWRSQQDKQVRKTHRKLNGKTFVPEDPPTTIDEYENKHTGNPGTDWGCRCYRDVPKKGARVLRNYTVRAKEEIK